ncbi:MAG TPA: four helix bundle protein [Sphingobacteriaceae bacterium]|nr:four helix bundle protein [Sphingobacteriaceae bacterium]
MSFKNIEDLDVYNLSNALSDDIWTLVNKWDYFAKDTIGKQLVRAADSISANIAEGYGRYHYKENRNFCYYSRGSIFETKNWLQKARSRNLSTVDVINPLLEKLDLIHRKLNGYMKFIGKSSPNEPLNK